jgi:hypothetical protein
MAEVLSTNSYSGGNYEYTPAEGNLKDVTFYGEYRFNKSKQLEYCNFHGNFKEYYFDVAIDNREIVSMSGVPFEDLSAIVAEAQTIFAAIKANKLSETTTVVTETEEK